MDISSVAFELLQPYGRSVGLNTEVGRLLRWVKVVENSPNERVTVTGKGWHREVKPERECDRDLTPTAIAGGRQSEILLALPTFSEGER
jgi:hypothetical protein